MLGIQAFFRLSVNQVSKAKSTLLINTLLGGEVVEFCEKVNAEDKNLNLASQFHLLYQYLFHYMHILGLTNYAIYSLISLT